MKARTGGERGKPPVQVLFAMTQKLPDMLGHVVGSPWMITQGKGPSTAPHDEKREFDEREHVLKAEVRHPIDGA